MNEIDKRYWNGFLDGILAVERQIEWEGIADTERDRSILKAISDLRKTVERLHANDVLAYLMEYEDKDVIEIKKAQKED